MIEFERVENLKKQGSTVKKELLSSERKKTGLDVAKEVKKAIQKEYPDFPDAHAMQLAVMLTKESLKNSSRG